MGPEPFIVWLNPQKITDIAILAAPSSAGASSGELDPAWASPAGLTRGSILLAKGWIAGLSPAMTADCAATSPEHALETFSAFRWPVN
jgi:hypothetical protein